MPKPAAVQTQVIWQPQPGPQTHLIECPVFEVFYGGARGGGKTESSIGDWLEHHHACGSAANGIFLRRTHKQLEEVVARTKEIFPRIGARWRGDQKSEWEMSNGARLKFRYLERDSDADEYQGHSYTRVYVEEATNFPSPSPINKMRATLRSARGAPCGMRLTGNPGGPGHNWVKERYITPCKTGYKVLTEEFRNPFTSEIMKIERVFIPSKLSDNPLLLANDPMYVARLQQSGSAALVKAWLDGDWDIIEGAFFDEFNPYQHVLPTEAFLERIPREAMRFRAFDWGSAKPFSVGWYALWDSEWGEVNGIALPKDALIKYREWYGVKLRGDGTFEPNVGLKMTAEEVAEGVKERERGERIKYGVADPSIFVRDGGPSIGERMLSRGVVWRAADRKRKTGWDQLHQRLRGVNSSPMLYFLDCCEHTIRTLPVLQHDEHDPEDVDTDGEDHAGDETRYAVMSRPFNRVEPVEPVIIYPKVPQQMTIRDLVEKRTQLRKQREGAAI